MRTVHIDTSRPYDVLIGQDLLPQVGKWMAQVMPPVAPPS